VKPDQSNRHLARESVELAIEKLDVELAKLLTFAGPEYEEEDDTTSTTTTTTTATTSTSAAHSTGKGSRGASIPSVVTPEEIASGEDESSPMKQPRTRKLGDNGSLIKQRASTG